MEAYYREKDIIKKMQKTVLEILCDIDGFCKENNIKYFLSGGTVLGAVRHNGFIPWDKDADIMMPREEYEKFLVQFKEDFNNKYYTGSLYTDPEWNKPWARICDRRSKITPLLYADKPAGIHVDVFPIDGLPTSDFRRNIFYKTMRVLNIFRNSSINYVLLEDEKGKLLKIMSRVISKPLGPRFFAVKEDNLAKRNPFQGSNLSGAVLAVHYWEKETLDSGCFSDALQMDFEGYSFPVPVGYDQYLRNLYGDYMEIPEDAEEAAYKHLNTWKIEFDTD